MNLTIEAQQFCSGQMDTDQDSKELLKTAKSLIGRLLKENQRLSSNTGMPFLGLATWADKLWPPFSATKRENGDKQKEHRNIRGQLQRPDEIQNLRIDTPNAVPRREKKALIEKAHERQESKRSSYVDKHRQAKMDQDVASMNAKMARQDCHTLETRNDFLKPNFVSCRLASSVKPMFRTDKRMAENINEQCRPSAIAVRYNTLESQEWMDAKDSMEDISKMEEEKITRFLCSAIMKTYDASCEMYRCLEFAISELIKRPSLAINIVQGLAKSELTPLPDDISDVIHSRLRQSCDRIDSGELFELTMNKVKQEFNEDDVKSLINNKAVNRYLQESARLTWQMAIQQPPMKMSDTDKRFNAERHKLWWSCKHARVSRIRHFIWPVLYDYEDGNLMVKGCVYAD